MLKLSSLHPQVLLIDMAVVPRLNLRLAAMDKFGDDDISLQRANGAECMVTECSALAWLCAAVGQLMMRCKQHAFDWEAMDVSTGFTEKHVAHSLFSVQQADRVVGNTTRELAALLKCNSGMDLGLVRISGTVATSRSALSFVSALRSALAWWPRSM